MSMSHYIVNADLEAIAKRAKNREILALFEERDYARNHYVSAQRRTPKNVARIAELRAIFDSIDARINATYTSEEIDAALATL